MGKLYTRFAEIKKQATKDWFMDKVGLVKFEDGNKKTLFALTNILENDIIRQQKLVLKNGGNCNDANQRPDSCL